MRDVDGVVVHTFVDPDRTLLIVVGAHLQAEISDRRIAYGLRDRLLAHVDAWETPPAILVCTDLWYLNHDDLRRCPTISVGAPEVNALTAYLADRLDSVLAVEGEYIVQLDERLACCWGVDVESTIASVVAFSDRYLEAFVDVVRA